MEVLTLSDGLEPPGQDRAVCRDVGPHTCQEAALPGIGSGRQTWSWAKELALGGLPPPGGTPFSATRPEGLCPSCRGPGDMGPPPALLSLGSFLLLGSVLS